VNIRKPLNFLITKWREEITWYGWRC